MTENEANGKWCPFVRYLAIFSDDNGKRECAGSYNRGYQDSGISQAPCIGSKCMAWRWKPLMADSAYQEAVKRATEEAKATGSNPKLAAETVNKNRAKYGLADTPFDGYCGLAGTP